MKPYKPRPIRFIEIFQFNDWKLKVYSISDRNEYVSKNFIFKAKENLGEWLHKSTTTTLETYKTATLILHEGKEGCFAIINWWIDENMLQHFVYLSSNDDAGYNFYSDSGIITCVWELSVLWFERNAWVKHILKNNSPDFESYLNEQLNQD